MGLFFTFDHFDDLTLIWDFLMETVRSFLETFYVWGPLLETVTFLLETYTPTFWMET